MPTTSALAVRRSGRSECFDPSRHWRAEPLSATKVPVCHCLHLAKDSGFYGIELNCDLDNDLSPKSGTREYHAIRRMADEIRISISGVCSFPFWPNPLTSNDVAERNRGLELVGLMTGAAQDLGTDNLLVVLGAVHIPWRAEQEPTPNNVCDQQDRAAIGQLVAQAESLKVHLNIENIFFNG